MRKPLIILGYLGVHDYCHDRHQTGRFACPGYGHPRGRITCVISICVGAGMKGESC